MSIDHRKYKDALRILAESKENEATLLELQKRIAELENELKVAKQKAAKTKQLIPPPEKLAKLLQITSTYEAKKKEMAQYRKMVLYAQNCRNFIEMNGTEELFETAADEINADEWGAEWVDTEKLSGELIKSLQEGKIKEWLDKQSDIYVIALAHTMHAVNNIPEFKVSYEEKNVGGRFVDEFYVCEDDLPDDDGWLSKPEIDIDKCEDFSTDYCRWGISFNEKIIENYDNFINEIQKFNNKFNFTINSVEDDLSVWQIDTS